jgi:hypothetical protein
MRTSGDEKEKLPIKMKRVERGLSLTAFGFQI